ncbi:MAG TPA: hypothetical protein VGM90_17650 [Kofleriaceae bacterium]|jgi:hypothetical protein
MKSVASTALLLAACRPLPPVPTLPVHASTEGPGEGATTALIVVGWAGTPLGGGGFGGALRVEHQYTDATTLGVELTGGRGDDRIKNAHEEYFRQWLLGVRGYGRSQIGGSRYANYTYGAGLAIMGSGAFVAQLHGGGLFGVPNEHAEPLLQLSLAASLPILAGMEYGDAGRASTSMPSVLYFVIDGGALFHPSDSDGISLDVGGAVPIHGDDALMGVTAADSIKAN